MLRLQCHQFLSDVLSWFSSFLVLFLNNMLSYEFRTFIECEHVKAIACISCCYNLLSEEGSAKSNSCCFPISKGGKSLGLSLGRNARDLGCQVKSFDEYKIFQPSKDT